MYDQKIASAQGLATAIDSRSPVERSLNRLAERIGQLNAVTETLTCRLQPVSREDGPTAQKDTTRPKGDCTVSEQLDEMEVRLGFLVDHINDTRERLCI